MVIMWIIHDVASFEASGEGWYGVIRESDGHRYLSKSYTSRYDLELWCSKEYAEERVKFIYIS